MSGKKNVVVFVVVMVFSLFLTTMNAIQIDDITCSEALFSLIPCVPFLEGSNPPTPSPTCCSGANNLYQKANTTQIRRNICKCFKAASTKFGVNPDRAKQLPGLCSIPLSFPFDPKADCNT